MTTKKPSDDWLFVLFCCNDPDTGNVAGEVTGIEITTNSPMDVLLELEGTATYREAEADRYVEIDGHAFPIRSRIGEGVGNRCWNGAWLEPQTVADLLEHLRRPAAPGWTVKAGVELLYLRWETGEAITVADLLQAAQPDGMSVEVVRL